METHIRPIYIVGPETIRITMYAQRNEQYGYGNESKVSRHPHKVRKNISIHALIYILRALRYKQLLLLLILLRDVCEFRC